MTKNDVIELFQKELLKEKKKQTFHAFSKAYNLHNGTVMLNEDGLAFLEKIGKKYTKTTGWPLAYSVIDFGAITRTDIALDIYDVQEIATCVFGDITNERQCAYNISRREGAFVINFVLNPIPYAGNKFLFTEEDTEDFDRSFWVSVEMCTGDVLREAELRNKYRSEQAETISENT